MSTPIDPPVSRRAARQSEVTAQDAPHESFAQAPTRRSRASEPASVPTSVPGEVSYRTEVRPRVPHYDAPPAGHAATTPDGAPLASPSVLAPAAAPVAPPTFGVPPLVEPPVAPPANHAGEQMRRRDFRPPVEQPPAHSMPPMPPGDGVTTGDAPLEYHTHMTANVPESVGHSAAFTGSAVDTPLVASAGASAPVEQTLSRRELRELRERAGLPVSEPPTATEAFGAAVAPVANPVALRVAPPSAPSVTHAPVAQAPLSAPSMATAAAAYQPPVSEALSAAPDASTSVSPSPATGSHWSVGIHDDDDPFENTFSREVGSAVSLSNTNALVLPEMPVGGISGPVAGTGEIIITGMIDLPRVVSSTGTVPTVHESPDIDDLFDPGDLAAGPADAAPVSALKAISSHTAARGIITTGKRSSSNAVTTVLVASTVVMAVVAIGLFVLAAVNGLF